MQCNCAEGLHFSAFHSFAFIYSRTGVEVPMGKNKLLCSRPLSFHDHATVQTDVICGEHFESGIKVTKGLCQAD